MALSNSEPCTQQQRPAAGGELQPADDRAAAVGTSSESDYHAASKAPAMTVEPSSDQKEKDYRAAAEEAATAAPDPDDGVADMPVVARRPAEESARERLKRHRTEMAGRVRIPEMWGQERLLKDWVDCAVFDRPLAATAGLLTARNALVAECAAARARRPAAVVVGVPHGTAARPLRVHNGCS